MGERDIEKGYASFHGKLNLVLRKRDVKEFKAHVARHPGQAGRLSHCLGLSNELAEVEMYKAILVRSALRDLHHFAREWLRQRCIEPPIPTLKKIRPKGRKGFAKKRGPSRDRK